MRRPVTAPLMLTLCTGCKRTRVCAWLPIVSEYQEPMCRQCIRRVMASVVPALLALRRQGR